jgi:DNA replication protein DnaC
VTTWLHAEFAPHPALLPPLELPPRFANVKFADIPSPGLRRIAQTYVKGFWEFAPEGRAPLFVGSVETYKTYTAALIAKAIHRTYQLPVVWVNCAEEFNRLERNRYSDETNARIHKLKTASFLVLDDVSQVPAGTWQMNIVVEIGAYRFDHLRPTLYTGNIDVSSTDTDVLERAFGACLSRRILSSSEGLRAKT